LAEWEAPKGIDADKLFDAGISWVVGPGLRIALIILLAWLAARIGRTFIQRSLALALHVTGRDPLADIQITKRRNTLTGLFVTVLGVTVISAAAVMIFKELNFEIGPILASAGIVGVAVGFGAQSLVKDVISGAFIVLEQQFGVGDVVKIGDRSGVVENIGLRTTTLRDIEGIAHIIPNGKIEIVSVMTKDWSQLVLDVDVAYDTDLHKAVGAIQNVLKQYAAEFSSNVLGEPQVLGVESFGDNSVKIRSTVKTAPGKQWEAGRIIRHGLRSSLTASVSKFLSSKMRHGSVVGRRCRSLQPVRKIKRRRPFNPLSVEKVAVSLVAIAEIAEHLRRVKRVSTRGIAEFAEFAPACST
jgi:moderate conductance mechanosensitive channel